MQIQQTLQIDQQKQQQMPSIAIPSRRLTKQGKNLLEIIVIAFY
jgi:hypothetical protein